MVDKPCYHRLDLKQVFFPFNATLKKEFIQFKKDEIYCNHMEHKDLVTQEH